MTLGRKAVVVAVNLLVFLLLAEVVSLCAYAWETGTLYYMDRPDRALPETPERLEKHRIHPYFGYVWRPGASVQRPETQFRGRRNNHGFVSQVDYPYLTDQTVVGIFGGSLAANLALYEAEFGVLRENLAVHLGLQLEELQILNFAQPGYKQPQQLLVATYFRTLGQKLDLAICLDGFNEVALAGFNARAALHPAMPSVSHIGPLRDAVDFDGSSDALIRMARVREAWDRFAYRFHRAWRRTGWETRTATGFLFNWVVYKFHEGRYQRSLESHRDALLSETVTTSDSWLYLEPGERLPQGNGPERDALIAEAVDIWARASREFHRLQTANGDAFLQVLQPNQYYDTGRVASEEERQIAFSDRSPFGPWVPPSYPRFEAMLDEMRAAGIHAWSASRLYDDVAEPVYRDSCCHLNDLGNRLLAERLAELAAEALGRDTATNPSPGDPE